MRRVETRLFCKHGILLYKKKLTRRQNGIRFEFSMIQNLIHSMISQGTLKGGRVHCNTSMYGIEKSPPCNALRMARSYLQRKTQLSPEWKTPFSSSGSFTNFLPSSTKACKNITTPHYAQTTRRKILKLILQNLNFSEFLHDYQYRHHSGSNPLSNTVSSLN